MDPGGHNSVVRRYYSEMLILMERFYENPELLSYLGEIREGFQEEVIAELSSEGRVAVR